MLLNKKNYKGLNKVTFVPKKKLAPGGSLTEFMSANSQGIGAAGNMAGGMLDAFAGNSMPGSIGAGALKGAGSLSAFGPIGMGVGALAGGVSGWLGQKKENEQMANMKQQKTAMTEQWAMQNAGNAFLKGGKMKSPKLSVVKGGSLSKISPDAVEVNGDNPGATDGVELPDAYVNDQEVIDKKDRVFSDDVFLPNGKSIAKEAKRLEKMKSDNPRFKESNSRIDKKVDDLFNFQESTKTPEPTKGLKKGGKLKLAGGGDPMTNLNIFTEGPVNDSLQAMANKQPNFQPLSLTSSTPQGQVAGSGPTINPNSQQNQGFDWNKGLTQLATFGPNAVSGALQKRLKGPAMPQLETLTNMKRFSPDAQIAEAGRQYNQAQKALQMSKPGAPNLISGTGSLLARRYANENQIRGQVGQENIQLAAQEAFINQGSKARNAQKVTDYNNAGVDFQNKKLQMTSENTANLSGKILTQGREKNEMKRDSQAFQLIQDSFGDSKVLMREFNKNPALFQSLLDSLGKKGKKMGGKLPTKKLDIKKKKK